MFVSFDICWDSKGGLGLFSGSPSQRRARIPTYSQLFGVEIDVELFSCQTSTCRALCDYLRKLVHSLMTFLWLFFKTCDKNNEQLLDEFGQNIIFFSGEQINHLA